MSIFHFHILLQILIFDSVIQRAQATVFTFSLYSFSCSAWQMSCKAYSASLYNLPTSALKLECYILTYFAQVPCICGLDRFRPLFAKEGKTNFYLRLHVEIQIQLNQHFLKDSLSIFCCSYICRILEFSEKNLTTSFAFLTFLTLLCLKIVYSLT